MVTLFIKIKTIMGCIFKSNFIITYIVKHYNINIYGCKKYYLIHCLIIINIKTLISNFQVNKTLIKPKFNAI